MSGAPIKLGAFGVTACVGHLCGSGSGFVPYDPSWRTTVQTPLDLPSNPQYRPGDVTGDGRVGIGDLLLVVSSLGRVSGESGFDSRADVNGDGVVDLFDLVYVARYFNTEYN